MQYNKTKDGIYEPLKQKNVDTGMGLERTVAVLNNCDVYLIDTFKPIIEKIEKLSKKKYGSDENTTRSIRIIADHIRAAVFISGDERGIIPSNVGQGYVLRKLIRRTVRHGKKIGIEKKFIKETAEGVIQIFKNIYPELEKNKRRIAEEMEKEEEKFEKTLEEGIKEIRTIFERKRALGKLAEIINGKEAFNLFQSCGFPLEMVFEELENFSKVFKFNTDINKEKIKEEFENEFKKHQELSRTASAGAFKGGLADNSEEVVKYHTATHLLHQALREVLGEHVEQKGSNLTAERLRFDFSHQAKMTPEEILKVEKIVNEKIKEDLPVHFEMLTVEEAKKRGAIGLFEHKYATLGEKVKVYSIGNYSTEICGGPHVEHTAQIGTFKITKEEAVAAGIRRIKATIT
jgi:alanyl-tRNA synthetase